MKNIALYAIIACLLTIGSAVQAQEASTPLNNGRPEGVVPHPPATTEANAPSPFSHENSDADWDVNRDVQKQEESTLIFPQDFEVLQDELFNSASNREVVEQIEALKTVVRRMQAEQEALRRENEVFRRSLAACCSAEESGLGTRDAYLLQNAPNPFINATRVEYFVPRHLTNAVIELRDIKGALIATYPVRPGKGDLNIDRNNLEAGSYLYALTIDGEMVDTKVMIFIP